MADRMHVLATALALLLLAVSTPVRAGRSARAAAGMRTYTHARPAASYLVAISARLQFVCLRMQLPCACLCVPALASLGWRLAAGVT